MTAFKPFIEYNICNACDGKRYYQRSVSESYIICPYCKGTGFKKKYNSNTPVTTKVYPV